MDPQNNGHVAEVIQQNGHVEAPQEEVQQNEHVAEVIQQNGHFEAPQEIVQNGHVAEVIQQNGHIEAPQEAPNGAGWSAEEIEWFFIGLELKGIGEWEAIANVWVRSRTAAEVEEFAHINNIGV